MNFIVWKIYSAVPVLQPNYMTNARMYGSANQFWQHGSSLSLRKAMGITIQHSTSRKEWVTAAVWLL